MKEYFLFLFRKDFLLGRLKKILLVLILSLAARYNPGANERTDPISEKLVPGNVRLTNSSSAEFDFASCDKMISSFLHNWGIAGASVAVSNNGRLVFARGYGYADTSDSVAVEPYSKFRVASISKLVTAVAIMKLCEEGKLSPDDRVFGPGGVLDDTIFCNPKDKRVFDIKVTHLLNHEGGWSQRWGDQMFMPHVVAEAMGVSTPVDTRTIVRFALDKRLHFAPGKGRSYSNLGYSILGLIVEKASGVPYEDYCKKNIFEPLGIYDMMLARNLPDEKAPYEVTYYEPPDVHLKPSIYGNGELVHPCYGGNDIEALGGAGAWLATAPDLMRLMLAVDGFDTRDDILTDESIRFMTDASNGVSPVGWKATNNSGVWSRTGSFPGSAGMIKRQPDGMAWVVLFNSSSWNGPAINSYVNNLMSRVISRTEEWPDYDLFTYSLPVPLKYNLAQQLPE